MEVWLNPVLAASRHDLLILLSQSQTAPPLLAHSVYYSFFHSGLAPPPAPTDSRPSMISPSCTGCPPHPVSLFCKCTFVTSQEFLREEGEEEDQLIKQTTTAIICTDMLLCTAGLQPVLQHSGGLRLSEVQGQEDRKGHQLHAQDRRVKRNIHTSTRGSVLRLSLFSPFSPNSTLQSLIESEF